MAEFLTMDEAKSKFGTKGRTNAGLTLGIIGTALAAFAGNKYLMNCLLLFLLRDIVHIQYLMLE